MSTWPVYELIGDDKAPMGMLIVTICLSRETRKAILAADLEPMLAVALYPDRFMPLACMSWTTQLTNEGVLQGNGIGCIPARDALMHANDLCELLGLERIGIRLEERHLWRSEWGDLAAA